MLRLAKAARIQMQNRQMFFSPNLTACTKEKSSATSDSTFSRICAWPKWQGLHGTKRFNVIITNSKIPRYANYSILADVQGFKKLFWPGALSHRFQNFVSATALRLVWLPNSAASHPGQIRLNKDLGEFKDFGGTQVIVMSPFILFHFIACSESILLVPACSDSQSVSTSAWWEPRLDVLRDPTFMDLSWFVQTGCCTQTWLYDFQSRSALELVRASNL